MDYLLFTDGACEPNPGKGGWAFILRSCPEDEITEIGYEDESTNNRMELSAVLNGIKRYKKNFFQNNETLTVYSDSKYVVDGINEWMEGWKKRGWKRRGGKVVINEDLWRNIYELCQGLNVTCIHVKGHSGHIENERCDKLAVEAISRFLPGSKQK